MSEPIREAVAQEANEERMSDTSNGFDVVTGWSARKRHLAVPGTNDMLCGRGSAVRPGDLYVGRNRAEMTQDRIDAMGPCKGCAAVAKAERNAG